MKELLKNRQLLHDRHRLSHEQIDLLLGESRARDFIQERIKRMASVKHFLDITDRLRESGLSFICLKGPLLSYRMYGDATVRFSHDIDLLVEMNAVSVVCEQMRSAGFELMEGDFWPDESFKQDLIRQSVHHLSFYNKQQQFCVEIHWRLTTLLPLPMDEANRMLRQHVTTTTFSGREFTVFTKEFEVTYLLIHGSKHAWSRLKWLVDLKDYPFDTVDLNQWRGIIDAFHADRILGQTNLALERCFNQKLPLEGSKRLPAYLVRYMEKALLNPVESGTSVRSIIKALRYQLLLFPDLRYQWQVCKSQFTRPADMLKYDFASKRMYYLFRPLSFIKRRILHA
jgi:hypothetical protein